MELGCALYRWEIHAPGILSSDFADKVQPISQRVGLYVDPSVEGYLSKNRGGKLADPQTYYVGEAYVPMLIEGFQAAFEEFVFFEIEPTSEMMQHYGIHYAAVVRIQGLANRVTLKGQALQLMTETAVFDSKMQRLAVFQSSGSSDAEKIFSKKGGPEVNLNAAMENNILAIVQYLQDAIATGNWK